MRQATESRLRSRAAILGLVTVAWACALQSNRAFAVESDRKAFPFFDPVTPPRPVQVMVHRGLMRQAPENSRPAIEMAAADGLEWVEIDLRQSKDETHVVWHDPRLDEKSSGRGELRDQTVEKLQALDVGSWFARRYAGLRMLTLDQALALAKGRINLYLDCKEVDPATLVREIVKAGMERQVIVYGDAETIAKVRELSDGKVAVMAKWHPNLGLEPWAAKVRPTAVEIDADEVTADACRAFHALGIKVEAKTLGRDWDRPEVWSRVIGAGVDWIQTDRPTALLRHSLELRKVPMPVKIAFHRGASRYAPENTLPAIETATELGADYVEIDFRTTRDGQFFLQHDATLNRTTSGTGPFSTQTGEALARLDAGSWFGRPYAGARVPTLDEALTAMHGKCHAYLDAKAIAPEALAAAIEKHQIVDRSVVYQHPLYLKRLKALNPKIRLLPPLPTPALLDTIADALQPYGFDAKWSILSKDLIDRCHARGIRVFSDAIGEHERLEDYNQAIDWGIDVIQTDHPARVWRAIELRQLRGAGQASR